MAREPLVPEDNIPDDRFLELIQHTALQAHSGVVLVRTSVLDANLEILIQLRMPNLSNRLREKLFEGYGPVATFSAKIDIAYAFGIIDQDTRQTLNALREIRNAFAHNTAGVHFGHQDIAKLVAKLPPPPERQDDDDDYMTFIRITSGLHEIFVRRIHEEQGGDYLETLRARSMNE